jgi:DNA-binding protein YbaB
MWILHFLPDSFIQFIVHTILLAGVVGCILSFLVVNKLLRFFPPFGSYVNIAQIISAILLAAGIYFEGGYSTEMQWRERVREMEAKVAKAEQESKDANIKLDQKSEAKVKVIKGKQVIVKQYIDREVTKYDNTCKIPEPVIKAHNAAAKNEGIK